VRDAVARRADPADIRCHRGVATVDRASSTNSTPASAPRRVRAGSCRHHHDIAVPGSKLNRRSGFRPRPTRRRSIHQYSPETLPAPSSSFAVEICEAILENLGSSTPREKGDPEPARNRRMATPISMRTSRMVRVATTQLARPVRAVGALPAQRTAARAFAARMLAVLAGADLVRGHAVGMRRKPACRIS